MLVGLERTFPFSQLDIMVITYHRFSTKEENCTGESIMNMNLKCFLNEESIKINTNRWYDKELHLSTNRCIKIKYFVLFGQNYIENDTLYKHTFTFKTCRKGWLMQLPQHWKKQA